MERLTQPTDSNGHTRVFVYGTLKPGECRWSSLAPYVSAYEYAVVNGYEIFVADGIPYPLVHRSACGVVSGYVCTLKPQRAEEAMSLLDRIEGFVPGDERRSLFVREGTVAVTSTTEDLRTWIYRAGPLSSTAARPLGSVSWSRGGD